MGRCATNLLIFCFAIAILVAGCRDYVPVVSDAGAAVIRAIEYPEYLKHKHSTAKPELIEPPQPVTTIQPP